MSRTFLLPCHFKRNGMAESAFIKRLETIIAKEFCKWSTYRGYRSQNMSCTDFEFAFCKAQIASIF
jgi:hypothetical protein